MKSSNGACQQIDSAAATKVQQTYRASGLARRVSLHFVTDSPVCASLPALALVFPPAHPTARCRMAGVGFLTQGQTGPRLFPSPPVKGFLLMFSPFFIISLGRMPRRCAQSQTVTATGDGAGLGRAPGRCKRMSTVYTSPGPHLLCAYQSLPSIHCVVITLPQERNRGCLALQVAQSGGMQLGCDRVQGTARQ